MGQADDLKRGITPLFQFWTQHSTLQHKINQCCNLWPDVTVPEKLHIHWYFGIRCFIFFTLLCFAGVTYLHAYSGAGLGLPVLDRLRAFLLLLEQIRFQCTKILPGEKDMRADSSFWGSRYWDLLDNCLL